MSTLGERIKYARESKELLQSDLAKLVGVKSSAVISNWEKDINKPNADKIVELCNVLDVSVSFLLDYYGKSSNDVTALEFSLIKKYRFISEHSPDGAKVVDSVLDGMYSIVEQMKTYESGSTVIEFHGSTDDTGRFLEYFRSASAGTGVFILGNEASEKIAIPDTPESRLADYAIGVDGDSMEPDYHDGDIVLVSQKLELNHGDVGIFVINNKAYIKEYGETELISRNPDADNIRISEYDNIVCMGKVIGKLSDTR